MCKFVNAKIKPLRISCRYSVRIVTVTHANKTVIFTTERH